METPEEAKSGTFSATFRVEKWVDHAFLPFKSLKRDNSFLHRHDLLEVLEFNRSEVITIDAQISISINMEEMSAATLLSAISRIIDLVDSATNENKGSDALYKEIEQNINGVLSLLEHSPSPSQDFQILIACLIRIVKKSLSDLYKQAQKLGLID